MDENGSTEQDERVRYPRNLQGILRFCLEQTKSEDAPEPSRFTEMSPEMREWLSKALEGMMGDPVKQMMDNIVNVGKFLGSENPTEEMRETAVVSLESLCDWCECIDMANDFLKVGGFAILHELMTHSDSEIRGYSFRLISSLVQNNPTCQRAAIDDDLIPRMLSALRTETDPTVQYQAVQAISCLVRDGQIEGAQEQFIACDGFEALRKVLQSPGPMKRVAKVAFFLTIMCEKNPAYKDMVCDHGIIELLVSELKGDHDMMHELVVQALLALAKGHNRTQSILACEALGVKQLLENRIQLLSGSDQFLDEKRYMEELLQIINNISQ